MSPRSPHEHCFTCLRHWLVTWESILRGMRPTWHASHVACVLILQAASHFLRGTVWEKGSAAATWCACSLPPRSLLIFSTAPFSSLLHSHLPSFSSFHSFLSLPLSHYFIQLPNTRFLRKTLPYPYIYGFTRTCFLPSPLDSVFSAVTSEIRTTSSITVLTCLSLTFVVVNESQLS